jgi:hypothetical protein
MGRSVLVRRFTMDRKGNRVEASRFQVTRCAFAPEPSTSMRATEEDTDRSNRVVADAELYTPYTADIRSADEVELWDGSLWEVAGSPQPWQSPFAGLWGAGRMVPLRRITG